MAGGMDALRRELEAERRAREQAEQRIFELESEMETRRAESRSLQHTVSTLAQSVDQLTALVERVAPQVGAPARRKIPSPIRAPRAASPGAPQPRGASPTQRQGRAAARVPSPQRRAGSAGRVASPGAPPPGARTPLTGLQRAMAAGAMANGTRLPPPPVISSAQRAAPGGGGAVQRGAAGGGGATQRGATAVRAIHADYVAGLRHPPFLRSCVFPPEGLEELQSRQSQLPAAKLELQTIFGCNVEGYNCNIAYTGANDRALFYAASVAVSMDIASRRQSFCFHHTDEVTSLAVHPIRRSVVATGQRGQRGGGPSRGPAVHIWSVETLGRIACLRDFHDGCICCLAFSPDGELLATVGADPHRTMALYRWDRDELLAHARVGSEPVYGVLFNPFSPGTLVSHGRKSIKFWEVQHHGQEVTLHSRGPQLGSSRQDGDLSQRRIVCAAWADARTCITGTDTGALLLWEDETLVAVHEEVHQGGVSSVSCVRLSHARPRCDVIVSGGRDGYLLMWSGSAGAELLAASSGRLPPPQRCDLASLLRGQREGDSGGRTAAAHEILGLVTGGRAPVRSFDACVADCGDDPSAAGVRLLVMLFSNQVLEVDCAAAFGEQQTEPLRVLVQGHSALPTASLSVEDDRGAADVNFDCLVAAAAAHPQRQLCATVGSDSVVRFWRGAADEWALCAVAPLEGRGCSCDWAPDGATLAVGTEAHGSGADQGGAVVLRVDVAADGTVRSCKTLGRLAETCGADALAVRFDPSGKLLAVGGAQMRVDLYDATQLGGGAARIGVTKGHAQAVTRIDWAADGSCFQTDDRTPEHLYFLRDCSRVTKPIQMRNVTWATWTCAYGWHVQGIWDEHMDQDSLSAVALSPDGDICATADSEGNVSLFAFPVPMQWASHKKYRGHSRRVTGVAFVRAAPAAFSTAADGCVFQWRVVRDAASAAAPARST
eukprot:TRINITY_DN47146_c0_g1_i1.p1 TRINITY_DN47146_c0_g1~~TRINITY_DN47146_c0_g1_i1.p1  ORF type:complete len:969 (+),score=272.67 TRINITY_DN47146_c0_g1_i1:71-2908(+)